MPGTIDIIQLISNLSPNEIFLVGMIWSIIEFFIAVWIARWIFKVDKIVETLEKISDQINELPKKSIEWDDIMKK